MGSNAQADLKPLPSVKSKNTPAPCSPNTGPASLVMTTLEPLPPPDLLPMELPLTSSAAASPAKIFRSLERASGLAANGLGYGASMPELLASLDPVTSLWKTSQHCLIEGLQTFSETWPRSGIMRNGIAYQLPPLVHLTDATECGLLRTQVASNTKAIAMWSGGREPCNFMKEMWPTPTRVTNTGGAALCKWGGAGSRAKLSKMVTPEELNGALNPTWVEWLMGFPLGWTDLEASATPLSRKSQKSLAAPLCKPKE